MICNLSNAVTNMYDVDFRGWPKLAHCGRETDCELLIINQDGLYLRCSTANLVASCHICLATIYTLGPHISIF
jgi:hypothetical protein